MKRTSIYYIGFISFALIFLCSSCNIYKAYQRPETIKTPDSFRLSKSETDTTFPDSSLLSVDRLPEKWDKQYSDTNNLSFLPYTDFFKDSLLQIYICEALENNFDLQTAFWKVKEYEAKLRQSRLAFTPSLSLNPNLEITSQNTSALGFSIPASASWEIDLFGKLLNAKRGALANLLQYESYKREVQTILISSVANAYFTLIMLDKQLAILKQTSLNWDLTVNTMQALKQSGLTNEAAVAQSLSNSYGVKADIIILEDKIREQENILTLLLGKEAQHIERSDSYTILEQTPDIVSTGIPLQLLSRRPDIQQAEAVLMSAYANTNVARASFYPQLTLSANGAWTNIAGIVANPAKLVWSALASLATPLFNRGQLISNLRVAKAQQEEAVINFQKTIISSCNEVSNAYNNLKATSEIMKYRRGQVDAMSRAAQYTQSLLLYGTSSYLEVITAQQNLLLVQLEEVNNLYNRMKHMIELYRTLGGGADQKSLINLTEKVEKEASKGKTKKHRKNDNQI